MKILCTKCGGTHVSCEAIVDPNSKKMIEFTEESLNNGWCDDCKAGVVLSDRVSLNKAIDKMLAGYLKDTERSPQYARCHIVFSDNGNDLETVWIKLNDTILSSEDDNIFFYCSSIEDFKSLGIFMNNDFILVDILYFTSCIY